MEHVPFFSTSTLTIFKVKLLAFYKFYEYFTNGDIYISNIIIAIK